ncbi:unnamed protein product [Didymodactylos carnosus]|uniref:Uncharacterized protein n=1 Tax=Didymodactylos carnosus TaxID=1234261 RepID=A0A8S2NXH5_9BILA|nr:unnamed protein product [Didymodactylos carnosus]CAF4017002.1 unnamed protein product [Didymodactylos carnosus]
MIWWKVCIPLQRELLRKCPQKTPSDTVRHIIQAIYPGIVEQANIKENEIQDLCKSIISPVRSSSIDIHSNAKWIQNSLTVAGGNSDGNGINRVYNSCDLYVDDDQIIYVVDRSNDRIME